MPDDTLGVTLSAQDRWEINDVLARYCIAIDTRDFDLLREIFTDGSAIDFGADFGAGTRGIGADWFISFAKATCEGFARSHHSLGTSLVEASPEGARGRTYVTAQHVGHPPLENESFTICAWYLDGFSKTDAGWLISERTVELACTIGNGSVLTSN
jgi:hypothetical protein